MMGMTTRASVPPTISSDECFCDWNPGPARSRPRVDVGCAEKMKDNARKCLKIEYLFRMCIIPREGPAEKREKR